MSEQMRTPSWLEEVWMEVQDEIDAEVGPFHEPQSFNEWDDDLMHDVCGKRLAKPVQDLLITLSQIKQTAGSFGMDSLKSKAKAYDDLVPELEALLKACKETWEEM